MDGMIGICHQIKTKNLSIIFNSKYGCKGVPSFLHGSTRTFKFNDINDLKKI